MTISNIAAKKRADAIKTLTAIGSEIASQPVREYIDEPSYSVVVDEETLFTSFTERAAQEFLAGVRPSFPGAEIEVNTTWDNKEFVAIRHALMELAS